MQGIGDGSGFLLADPLSLVRRQVFGFSLDLVESTDVLQGLGSQLALVGVVQVVELAPGVGHATDFGDAVAEPGLVASVVITDQFALPVAQEGAGVLARSTGSEVVNGGLQVRERGGAVGPDVSLMGFLLARGQHADRGFVSVQNRALQQNISKCIYQRLQLHATSTDPFSQSGTRDFEAGTAEDAFLTRSEEHTSELQSRPHLVCRLLLEKKNK